MADISDYVIGGSISDGLRASLQSLAFLATPWARGKKIPVSSHETPGKQPSKPEVKNEFYYFNNFNVAAAVSLTSNRKKEYVAKVQKAEDGRHYVVKSYVVHSISPKEIEQCQDVDNKKLREPAILSEMLSPHVVRFCDSWIQEKSDKTGETCCLELFIQMEYVDTCMKDYIRKRKIESPVEYLKAVVPLMRDFAAGLQALHRHGVVHRGVRLSALFFDASFVGKIGGFRLGRFIDEGNDDEHISPPQEPQSMLSPEQKKGESVAKKAAYKIDVYGLGVCFAAIVGKEPEDSDTIKMLQGGMSNPRAKRGKRKSTDSEKSGNKEPVFSQKLPPDAWWECVTPFVVRDKLKQLILSMVKENPDDRPDLDTVINELESISISLNKVEQDSGKDKGAPEAKKQKIE